MNSVHCRTPRRPRDGFTLVEIMIAVVIIGLLAAMAIPALTRSRQASQNARFISDLRTFAQAFETYATQSGGWPANGGTGVVPAGMTAADIKVSAWTTAKNSVGGRWNWDRTNLGVAAAISAVNVTVTDAQMQAVDRKIDDGDLTTGLFQKISLRFVYILEN
jgi:prepilin-type N-terminal cleavage/methylation domain-containing protein